MKRLKITGILLAFLSVVFLNYQCTADPTSDESETPISMNAELDGLGEFDILSAIQAENLQVFMINGDERLEDKTYTTLTKAMEENLVSVKETGSVNELIVDNNSDETIFIHSGDIVKGGKQDRTMAYDMIIPPNSKGVALESYCVESGRWQSRGNEAVSDFNSTTKMLSSRDLKMAAKYDNDQSKVWENVSSEQQKLNYNVSKKNGYTVNVASDVSATSLQLTLESEELEKAREKMDNALKSLLDEYPEAIGYAYAINGEVYGVDIYNNRQLFEEIWEKIAESIVTEAIANQVEETYSLATLTDVSVFMQAVQNSESTESSKSLNEVTDFTTQENKAGNVVFSTVDNETEEWVHKNYMKANLSEEKSGGQGMNNEQQLNNMIELEEQIQR